MQQQDEEIQTPIIDTSDSNLQTNKMEHNDQMSQVDTNALKIQIQLVTMMMVNILKH